MTTKSKCNKPSPSKFSKSENELVDNPTKILYGIDEVVNSTIGKIVIIYEKDGSKSYHKIFEKNDTVHMLCIGIISKEGNIIDIYG